MPASYSEPLRIIGQWLDHQAAEGLELTCAPQGMIVRWFPAPGGNDARAFTWTELARVHEQASRSRHHPFGDPSNRWAGALRTLGQELDAMGVEPQIVRTLRDGVQVSGNRGGVAYSQWHSLARLIQTDRIRRSENTPA